MLTHSPEVFPHSRFTTVITYRDQLRNRSAGTRPGGTAGAAVLLLLHPRAHMCQAVFSSVLWPGLQAEAGVSQPTSRSGAQGCRQPLAFQAVCCECWQQLLSPHGSWSLSSTLASVSPVPADTVSGPRTGGDEDPGDSSVPPVSYSTLELQPPLLATQDLEALRGAGLLPTPQAGPGAVGTLQGHSSQISVGAQ